MNIDNFEINESSKVFIIAELSANHNGSLETAIQTIKAAKKSGADAIKLQTYTADTITLKSEKDDFIIKDSIWKGQYLYDLYNKAYTPWEWHEKLFNVAKEEGLICFSSPFDKTAVDFLETLNVPAYKIASFEITDIPLISYVAKLGKPMILSTGIATDEDIKLALDTCYKHDNKNIILLKCTSSYPTPLDASNICMIKDMKDRYNVLTGLSDHTLGSIVPILSVAYGARVIEKHFIINKEIGGPDSSFSLDKDEFKKMVDSVRKAESAIGNISYELSPSQVKSKSFSRSLYVVENIKKDSFFTEENVKSIRPGFGLHPKYLNKIIGKKSNSDLEAGTRFDMSFII